MRSRFIVSHSVLRLTPSRSAVFDTLPQEMAVCFVNVGTVAKANVGRARPSPAQFVTSL